MTDELAEPPADPDDLSDFPRLTLGPRVPTLHLYRVHPRDLEPNFYGSGGNRFDPPAGDDSFGTCYCSDRPEGALVEVFGHTGPVVSDTYFASRALSHLELELRGRRIADLTNPSVLGRYGLTGTASAGGPASYAMCQRWAAALFAASFHGIAYRARHDPSLHLSSYAIFGEPGVSEEPLTVVHTEELTTVHLEQLEPYGIVMTLPPAPL